MRKKRREQSLEPRWSHRPKEDPSIVDFMGSRGPLRARKWRPGELSIPPEDAEIWQEEQSHEVRKRMARTAIVDGEPLNRIIY